MLSAAKENASRLRPDHSSKEFAGFAEEGNRDVVFSAQPEAMGRPHHVSKTDDAGNRVNRNSHFWHAIDGDNHIFAVPVDVRALSRDVQGVSVTFHEILSLRFFSTMESTHC